MDGDLGLSATQDTTLAPPLIEGGFTASAGASPPGDELTAEQADAFRAFRSALKDAHQNRRMMSEEQRVEHVRSVALAMAERDPGFSRRALRQADQAERELQARRENAASILRAQLDIAECVSEDGLTRLTHGVLSALERGSMPVLNAERFLQVHQARLFDAVDNHGRPNDDALTHTPRFKEIEETAEKVQTELRRQIESQDEDQMMQARLGVDVSPPELNLPPVMVALVRSGIGPAQDQGRHDVRSAPRPTRRHTKTSGNGSRGDPDDPEPGDRDGSHRAESHKSELTHIARTLPLALEAAGAGPVPRDPEQFLLWAKAQGSRLPARRAREHRYPLRAMLARISEELSS